MYIVYGEESGEMLEFKTMKQAKAFVADAIRFDKEQGLDGENWIITYEED